jgi:hypothetical protein
MKLHEEFKLFETMWEDPTKLQEDVSPTYSANYAEMEAKFKDAVQEANFAWMNAIIDLGVDYNYFNSRVANKLRNAVTVNIAKDVPNAALEDLARTGDPKVDAAFEQFIEEEAGNFDESLDFYNWLYICYADGTSEFFDSYEDTFAGDKDDVECVVGIDYASGASICWIRNEDSIEELDDLLGEAD